MKYKFDWERAFRDTRAGKYTGVIFWISSLFSEHPHVLTTPLIVNIISDMHYVFHAYYVLSI